MEEYPLFMTCILRIDINADKWQRTIAKVLKNVNETNCRMNTDGTVEISGTVYLNKFLEILKKARSKAELCHFQFGECSTNLFLPPRPIDYGITNNMLVSSFVGQKEDQTGYYGGRDGRFLHYGDKPSQLKMSKSSSKENSHHNHDHNHNHAHGRNHNHNHDHIHGHEHNNNHSHNHNHNHTHDHNHRHHKERDYRNHDQLLHVDGGKGKHERKLEHAAGYINATTPRPKVQLDCEKLKSKAVKSCCLM